MAKKFYQLTLLDDALKSSVAREAIEQVLNRATDWFRFAPNCWLIYSSRNADIWQNRLIKIPEMKDRAFFVCAIDKEDRGGLIDSHFWDWLDKNRPENPA